MYECFAFKTKFREYPSSYALPLAVNEDVVLIEGSTDDFFRLVTSFSLLFSSA